MKKLFIFLLLAGLAISSRAALFQNYWTTNASPQALYAGVASNYTGQRVFGSLVHAPGTIAAMMALPPSTLTPFRLVMFGDSLPNNMFPYLLTYLQNRGVVLGYFVGQNDLFNGATYNNLDFTNWVNGEVTTLPANSYCVPDSGTTTYFGDTVELLILTVNSPGTMTVSNLIAGGSTYLSLTNFSTSAATTNLVMVTAPLPYAGMWSLKIGSSGGTCRLVGTVVYHHQRAGMTLYNFCQGGVGFSNFCLCYTNVLTQISTVIDPNLIIAQEIHSPYSGWINNGGLVIGSAALSTNTDVILMSANLTANEDLTQLLGPLSLASSNHWLGYDAHGQWFLIGTNSWDWTNAVANGYLLNDKTNPHPTPLGNNDEIGAMFSDIPFMDDWFKQDYQGHYLVMQPGNSPSWGVFNPLPSSLGGYITTWFVAGGAYQQFQGLDVTGTNSTGALFFNGTLQTIALNAPNGAAMLSINWNTTESTFAGDVVIDGAGGNKGLAILQPYGIRTYATNTLTISATGASNGTIDDYWLTITAGGGMSLKDQFGNQFITPVSGGSYPFKPGWTLSGTGITAQAVKL